jgi:hypothetical protein
MASCIRAFCGAVFAALLSVSGASVATAAIDVNKSFAPATVLPTQITRLQIRLFNSSLSDSISVALNDALPDGVFIAATPNVSNTCQGSVTATNNATNGVLNITNGVIPAGDGTNPGVCDIGVDVFAQARGTYINSVPIGALTGTTNGLAESNATAASATLAAILQDVTITLSSDLQFYLQGYETTVRRIRINNPNDVALTGVDMFWDLRSDARNIRIRDDLPSGSNCGATLAIAAVANPSPTLFGPTSTLTVTDGTIPANSICEIFVTIEPARDPLLAYNATAYNNVLPVNTVTSDQGATNSVASNLLYLATYTGVQVAKTFNNSLAAVTNINDTNQATLRLMFYNYNTQAVTNASIIDALPAGMTALAGATFSCAGNISTTPNTQVAISDAVFPGAPFGGTGVEAPVCTATVPVEIAGCGSYVNAIPAGTFNGANQYSAPNNASLAVSCEILTINKTLTRSGLPTGFDTGFFAGDQINAVFTIKNESTATPVTNIRIPDILAGNTTTNLGYGFRVGPGGITANTCGGGGTVVPDATSFELTGLSVDPGETCQVTVQLSTSSDAMTNAFTSQARTNRVPANSIRFDTPTNTDLTYGIALAATANMQPPVAISKSFTPAIVGPLGITRLRINITRNSADRIGMTDVNLLDNLPAGHLIADTPNLVNGCGGTVSAPAGGNSITLTGGSLLYASPTASRAVSCFIEVNVRAPAMTPPNTVENSTNTIPGDPHGATFGSGPRTFFSGTDIRQASPYNEVRNLLAASATLQRRATFVVLNKEFLPVNINGGGQSRVRITFANNDPTAINVTGVSLTDAFGDTDLRLYSTVNPTFTNTSGVPNASGCIGGVFTGSPGATEFTMTGASIAAGSICRLEFNVTAFAGGNHINTIGAGNLITNEGITNPSDVSATLSVGYQIGVGKGFNPEVIEAGQQSTLTLDIYNTNVPPNDRTGAIPAIIDMMPAGVQIIPGTASTTCVGGTASSGVDTGLSFLRLDGGLFPAEGVCKVTAQVTATSTGVYLNQIPAGALRASNGDQSPDPAEARLRVIQHATITKAFSPGQIPVGGISRITFTLRNPNASALLPAGMTGLGFTDVMTDMQIASPLFISSGCSGFTHDAVSGGNTLNVSNVSLLPGATCTVQVDVTSSVPGQLPNQTSGVSSNQTIQPGAPSNIANLIVLQPLTLQKQFSRPNAATGEPVRLTFRITNPNAFTTQLSTPGFTDVFPTVPGSMVVAPVPGVTSTCVGGTSMLNAAGTAAPVSGDTGIQVRGGSLAPNASCEISVNVVVNAVGNYLNTTSQISSTGGIAPAASASIEGVEPSPALSILKTGSWDDANTDEIAQAGETISYSYAIRNDGNVTLTAVSVAELEASFTGTFANLTTPGFVSNSGSSPQGTLAPGETATWSATYTLTQADVDAGQVDNQARATGTPPGVDADPITDLSDPVDRDENAPTEVTLPGGPALSILKTGSWDDANTDEIAQAGETISYSYAIRNDGNVTLTAVSVAELEASFTGTFANLTTPGFVSNSGSSPQGTLAPGETATWSATYTLTQADVDAGQVDNQARATGTPPGVDADPITDLSDPVDRDENAPTEVTLPGGPALSILKTGSWDDANTDEIAQAGETISYSYAIRNDGNVTLTAVSVAELEASFTGTFANLTTPGFVSNSGSSPQGTLAPGETATWSATYTLTQADVDAGQVDNQARATGTPPGVDADPITDLSDPVDRDENAPTEVTLPGGPALSILKTGSWDDANTDEIAQAGETISYSYAIRNDGNVTLTAVSVAELEASFTGTFANLTTPGFVSNSGSSPQGTLAPGETATWSATYTLTQADVDAGQVDNQARATGTPPGVDADPITDLSDPVDREADAPTEVTLPGGPALSILKTGSWDDANTDEIAQAGETISYSYAIRNDGNVTLTAVSVAELEASFTGTFANLTTPGFVSNSGSSPQGTLAPGETATWSATYTLTQADVDAGQVDNQARATGTPPGVDADPITDLSDPVDRDENAPTEVTLPGGPALSILKTGSWDDANTDEIAQAGETISYSYAIRNDGNVTLTAVSVAELEASFTGTFANLTTPGFVSNSGSSPQGTLAPGETATWSATYTLTQADVDAGQVDNQARATGTPPGVDADPITDLSDPVDRDETRQPRSRFRAVLRFRS